MNKKLYRIALISSPIIAIYGVAPLYISNEASFTQALSILLALTAFVFSFWLGNIFLLNTLKNHKSWQRYILSYGLTYAIQAFFIILAEGISGGQRPINIGLLYPIIATFAINTIILILANSIVLQFQKENAELEIERLKVSNLEAQKQMLMQQLQPHFLFNALSTLKSLIGEKPATAEDYTVRLSEFLRYSIQAPEKELVSLAEELKFTQDYIDLQKARFGEALQYKINLPQEALAQKIPAYALQTLVENAIKHNHFTEKKPIFIQIDFLITLEANRVKVHNNKTFRRLNVASGRGLANLNQRYQLIANTPIQVVETEEDFMVVLNLL
jgi:two-component system, LytTR family, sensor kinase